MTEPEREPVGAIVGFDPTVTNADAKRDFYAVVIGWSPAPFDMGG